MSNKMCVCIVRDGVQMVLPVGSQNTLFSTLRVPENRDKTIEWELESVHSVCDARVP